MCSGIIFFVFGLKFGKTEQKVIALVATAFKIMFAVAKASFGLFGCEFCAGNINNLFLDYSYSLFS